MDFALDDGTVYGTYTGKEWRERRGLSAADCAVLDGGRSDRVIDSETGRKAPQLRVIALRARAWGCAPSDLWRWSDAGQKALAGKPRRWRLTPPDGAAWSDVGDYGGWRLAELRDLAGLTMQALAGRLGVSRQLIHQWESGQRVPAAATVWRLAKALGVPTGHLWRWA